MAEAFAREDEGRPRGTAALAAALHVLDRLFGRVYGWRHNPLYRTGTLATLFLTIALVTGVYLLFVYELGRPYDSVAAIQRDALLGRWMRALHRYASDAAVVAVALHVVRVVAQGKTWGPRTLAWLTGLLLTGMLFLSGITGFVLVWDEFGQKLALAGARIMRVLPLFPEPPDRAFVGDRPPPSQFFFMNLFLHVAVPLGMIAFLWLHTLKLARTSWFPERRLVVGATAALLVLALVWPAPLPAPGDLLAVPGRVATDWLYAFWLPAAGAPVAALTVVAVAAALLCAVPWLTAPGARRRPAPALVDPERCEGCRQCATDCPFDAVDIVPGLHPEKHPLRALVRADACVSCGLCAGSCSSLAVGPAGRTARDQLAAVRAFLDAHPDARAETLVVTCRNGRAAPAGAAVLDVECAGILHPSAVSLLAGRFQETVIAACARGDCLHREGVALAEARLFMGRAPAVPERLASLPLRLLEPSNGAPRADAVVPLGWRRRAARAAAAIAFSALPLGLLAFASGAPQGTDATHATVRLGWRLAGQARETCRDRGADELARLPVHMRTPRECRTEALAYTLRASVDGRVVVAGTVRPHGLRADRPLSVEEEVAIAPGEHLVEVSFVPEDPAASGVRLALQRRLRFDAGRVRLVTYENQALVVR